MLTLNKVKQRLIMEAISYGVSNRQSGSLMESLRGIILQRNKYGETKGLVVEMEKLVSGVCRF